MLSKAILQRTVQRPLRIVKQLHLHLEFLAVAVLIFVVEPADFCLTDIDPAAFASLQKQFVDCGFAGGRLFIHKFILIEGSAAASLRFGRVLVAGNPPFVSRLGKVFRTGSGG